MKNSAEPKKFAAFFDLDKTIIAKSSMLAFSKTFRKYRAITAIGFPKT